jgi:LysM repeat protein
MSKSLFRNIFLSAWIIGSLCGCRERPPEPTLTAPTPALTITPYQLEPIRPTHTPAPIITSTQEPLLPSPTPFLHTIEAGDTLIAIALQYNITLDDLLAANPGINSNQLSIGTEIIIPGENGGRPGLPTPTPLPGQLSEPNCYRTSTGALTCFFTADNPLDHGIENISVLANLHLPDGELFWSKVVIPPLDRIPPESSLPINLRVPAPAPDGAQLFLTLLTALPAQEITSQPEAIIEKIDYQQNRRAAQISGLINLPPGDYEPGSVWLAAAGYSSQKPVALRKWISSASAEPGEQIPFTITVYSPGPSIEEVRIFTELH